MSAAKFEHFLALLRRELSRVEKSPNSLFTKFIIFEKSIKGVILELLSISVFPIFSDEVTDFLHHIAARSHLLSSAHVINYLFTKVADASDRKLASFSLLFFLWGLLELSESVGLWKKRRWAEYLAVVGTGMFVPIEAYTLIYQPNIEKVIILFFNILLVIYLIWSHKLFFIQEQSDRRPSGKDAS